MKDSLANADLGAMGRKTMLHPVSSVADLARTGPTLYTRAKGTILEDAAGQEHIDMGAGLWCVNVGYGRPELVEAGAEALRNLSYQHHFGNSAAKDTVRLSERLVQLFAENAGAGHLNRVFYGTSGSDANDTAYKLVRYYNNLRGKPAKKKIISRIGSYHGLTAAATSLTGIDAYHKMFDLPLPDVLHTSCPHFYRYAENGESEAQFSARMVRDLENLIEREGPETIGAFIAEPVMGTGGVFLPPPGYFAKVQALLDKHDILLIADEVITGFGRLGHWFGTGAFDLKPDIVSLAKGLTSAYFPMSASMISDRVYDVLAAKSDETGAFMHGFTYSGHPVGSAIALANIDVIERENLVEQASEAGSYLLRALRQATADTPFVGDVRGMGLMIGIEYVADKATNTPFPEGTAPHKVVSKHAFDHGVLPRALPFLPVNSFSPPLNISREEMDEGVARFAHALEAAGPDLEKLQG
ncbi:aminotransferase [Paracoccus sp. Z330]|uniref:Aminotransferase n=1 Tax=Paracoccus onchidii TaxID=3017813 RepID=A0ABT4ZGB0_9RHOB|nr:aminotransferase [Paracoccus onchidii]MDB6178406.1 aminotransferase [Paracoccus onchidii]